MLMIIKDKKADEPKKVKPKNDNVKPKKPIGRQAGMVHLKQMDIEEFMSENQCVRMYIENQEYFSTVKLFENPYMARTLCRVDDKKKTIELSSKLFREPVDTIREVFIKACCHLLAIHHFDYRGTGKVFELLLKRYLTRDDRKLQQSEIGYLLEEQQPKNKVK